MTFRTATLFVKNELPAAVELGKELCTLLKENDIKPYIATRDYECTFFEAEVGDNENMNARELPESENLIIVLGGDGTLLSAARCAYGTGAPILGINFGHLGFLTETESHQAKDAVLNILNGGGDKDERPYFIARIERDGKTLGNIQPFINDAVIQRNADERMLNFSIDVADKFVTSSKADGLIISTPTGSTAYNLSAGGPIAVPSIDALIISPICPHTLAFRPIVLPSKEISLTIESEASHLSLDGRKNIVLQQGDKIIIEKSVEVLKLIHHEKLSFYNLLRQKLGWDLDL